MKAIRLETQVILVAILCSSAIWLTGSWLLFNQLEQDIYTVNEKQIRKDISILQREMERQLIKQDSLGAKASLASRGIYTNYDLLLAIDENYNIWAANHFQYINKHIADTPFAFSSNAIQGVLDSRSPIVTTDQGSYQITAYYPLALERLPHELRASRRGAILMLSNLSEQRATLVNKFIYASLVIGAIVLLSTFIFVWLLKRQITKPFNNLLSRIQQLAQTDALPAELQLKTNCKPPELHELDTLLQHVQLTISKNINTLEQKEQALTLFKDLVEQANDALYIIEANTAQVIDCNIKSCQMLGYSKQELQKLKIYQFGAKYNNLQDWQNNLQHLADTQGTKYQSEHISQSGKRIPVEISAKFISHHAHDFIVATVRDISEQLAQQHAIEQKERYLHTIIESMPQALCVIQQSTVITFNKAFAQLVGLEAMRLNQLSVAELTKFEPQSRSLIQSTQCPVNNNQNEHIQWKEKTGAVSWLQITRSQANCSGYQDPLHIIIASNVTQKHNLEIKLENNRSFLLGLLNSLPDPVFVKDQHKQYSEVNDAFCLLVGRKRQDILGKSDPDLFPQAFAIRSQEQDEVVVKQRQKVEHQDELETLQGNRYIATRKSYFINPITNAINLVGSIRDITENKLTEAALIQAQKMESVGRVVSSIAHDYNNIMGIVLGNIELLKLKTEPNDLNYQKLCNIQKSAQRAVVLTKQLLGFSRSHGHEKQAITLNTVINEVAELLNQAINKNMQLNYRLQDNLWAVNINKNDFENALLNLVINARDAMINGGDVLISSENLSVSAYDAKHYYQCSAGDYVQLTIQDQGVGINQDIQNKIFDPFFTTKPKGKGTGLGLASVFGFMQSSQGTIKLDSTLGKGSIFKLLFPRFADDKLTPTTHKEMLKSHDLSGVLLYVDDESSMLQMASEMLNQVGIACITAESSSQALALLKQRTDIFLVLTDILLESESGFDLANQVSTLFPNIPVRYASGYYSASAFSTSGRLDPSLLLEKPYNQKTLVDFITHAVATKQTQQARTSICWQPDYMLDNALMDHDHKVIFDLIQKCNQNLNHEEDSEQVNKLLLDIEKYTIKHFTAEEKMMEKAHYPNLDQHKLAHQKLLLETRDLREKISKFNAPVQQILLFLTDWWNEHIITLDRSAAHYMSERNKTTEQ
ncbi:hypothetical protein C2869_06000 [Saccharobesus litoralis]|uniref:histidine kinase n=1 Tax=Saccharobesus litoralis TaxID=2172099 RepID=A0A2S0VP71_9ALTE|nr:bacteriohemerythrin [Saccharobesus litoralis]AWB66017.1 hypothetical protein C2869_06000 [Saccharobesus litoralis]